jgi:coniferyl-aldehyde dehydrogenase
MDTSTTGHVGAAFEALKRGYQAERNPSASVREDRLERLGHWLQRERDAMVEAARADFGNRARRETLAADVLMSLESTKQARDHVREWMKRRPVTPQWYLRPATSWIEPQPLGVVAIISPWNYPVLLAVAPLAAALAAGNRALIKPSELTPKVSELLERMVRETFTPQEVGLVQGGPEVAQAVTALPLDHLFFTGSTAVGRKVAQAAAANLVPVTLELGGKSPALMHPTFPVETFAKRLATGKIFNAGQTCIAPDYVLLPKGEEAAFTSAFTEAVRGAVGDLTGDVTSVISDKAWKRVDALLNDAVAKGAKLVETVPGADASTRKRAPVLLFDVTDEMEVMQEEIFGPLLPVETYAHLDEAVERIHARARPLAFYYFDHDDRRVERMLQQVVAGGVCVNDTLLHFAQKSLPFGGVGPSGMGRYHGQPGFDAFSNPMGVFQQSRLSPVPSLLTVSDAVFNRAVDWFIGGQKRRPGQ